MVKVRKLNLFWQGKNKNELKMIYLQIKENKKELIVDVEFLNSSLKKFIGTSEK